MLEAAGKQGFYLGRDMKLAPTGMDATKADLIPAPFLIVAHFISRLPRYTRISHSVGKIRFARDSPLAGSGFELPVPRCALIANSVAPVAPPDSAVSGGSLNGRLTTPIGWWAGNCSADPPRGSIGPTRTRPRKPW
jgi:hypothetical protein